MRQNISLINGYLLSTDPSIESAVKKMYWKNV